MPRRARIDSSGARQHIIGRGFERRKIFRDDSDRQAFLGRLGRMLQETRSVLNPLRARLWKECIGSTSIRMAATAR
jgi:hypothetical protein